MNRLFASLLITAASLNAYAQSPDTLVGQIAEWRVVELRNAWGDPTGRKVLYTHIIHDQAS